MRLAVSLLVLALASSVARAAGDEPQPDAATLEEARRRFAEGQRLFEAGELKPAVEELKEAYRLTRNPLLLYNIGLIYDRLGDKPLALHYYTRFVDDARDTERTHAQLAEASKRASELRAELVIEEPPATPPPPSGEEPPAPTLTELEHEPIDQAPPGQPIDVTARIPRRAPWSVTLHYRAAGQDLYQPVKMRPRSGVSLSADVEELVARIPAAAARGSAVQYHVAARDPEGKLVGFSGKAQTPNIIYLDPAAPPHHFLEPGEAAPPPVPSLQEAAPREPEHPTRPLTYAKWAVSGTAVALLGTGVVLNLVARDYGSTLEDEASKSNREACGDGLPPPCRAYSVQRKDIDASGKRYETWSNVTLIAGAATALAAGALWYLDARAAVVPPIVPIVGKETAGIAAAWRF
jgi:hypothetical protein